MSKIEIKGFVLHEVLPLIDQVLDLPDGVSVLYGKNGVGKTQILRAVSHAARPDGVSPGSFQLFFHYPWNPVWIRRDLQQSPWFHNSGRAPTFADRTPVVEDLIANSIGFNTDEFRKEDEKLENHPTENLARYLYTLQKMSDANDEARPVLLTLCREVVGHGMFAVGFRKGGPDTILSPVVLLSDTTPTWKSIVADVESMSSEQLEDKYGLSFSGELQSYLYENTHKIESYLWHGYELGEIVTSKPFSPPIDLIDEKSEDLSSLTINFLIDLLRMSKIKHDSEIKEIELENISLLIESSKGFTIDQLVVNAAKQLSSRATEYFQKLMIDAPNLRCHVKDLSRWGLESAIEWVAEEKYREIQDLESVGHDLSISDLSNAQQRWARFAIKLSMINIQGEKPLLIVLDEPETGLHRRAERQLAVGLAEITWKFNAKCLIATHSPVFLNDKSNNLIHVFRNESGNTTLGSLSPELSERIDDYGIDRSDLLQFCSTFVIVEGEHDRWVLDEMFKSEFDKRGATVLALRGLKKLKLLALDSQFIFRFTTAEIVIMFDNDKIRVAQDIWKRACAAKDDNRDFMEILDEFRTLAKSAEKQADEYSMIHDFCVQAIDKEARNRVKFHGLQRQDIIDYFSPSAFIEQDLGCKEFVDLRSEFKKVGSSDFKGWLGKQYGASFAEQNFRAAVGQLDSIPTDFTDLLNLLKNRK